MKPTSVSHVMPGAAGLRVCRTYQGPMRVLVAFRVAEEFSIVQRGQVPCSLSFTEPQNGQTYFPRSDSRMPSAPAGCKAEVVDSVVCVTSPFKRVRIWSNPGSGSGPIVAVQGDEADAAGAPPVAGASPFTEPGSTRNFSANGDAGKFPAEIAAEA